jgi:hypothetical protein
MAITKSSFLTVRVPSKTRTMFVRKTSQFGKPSEVLRELIEAFIDGRLTIQKPVTSKKDKLYE